MSTCVLKRLVFVSWVLLAFGVFGAWLLTKPHAHANSFGSLPPCTSLDDFNRQVDALVSSVDWEGGVGEPILDRSVRQMIGSANVMSEMRRLGARACPDLDESYQSYLAAANIPSAWRNR
jgi:hypothetical protein